MVKKEILAKLIDDKKAAILQVVLNSQEEMYLKEIAEKSNVSVTSTFRILQELVKLEVLKKREWKTSKVYSCLQNDKVAFLKELFYEEFDGVTEFVKSLESISNIQNIILHGSRKKGKANILLIGNDIDVSLVEKERQNLKERNFELSYMTLTKEQYEQMAKMGLYSGEKKVLK
jgi:predicted transcriptional regulator